MTGAFDQWKSVEPAAAPVPRPQAAVERRQLVVPMMNKSQADIAYGFPGIAINDADYAACLLMNNVLGEYETGQDRGPRPAQRRILTPGFFAGVSHARSPPCVLVPRTNGRDSV